MHSLKPGRAPSFLGGIAGLFAAGFGIVWIIGALSMGAPWPFALFGVFFILLALVGAIYNFLNATQRNRFSTFDITTHQEEPDPLNQRFGDNPPPNSAASEPRKYPGNFCPFCGQPVTAEMHHCPHCGRDI